MEHPRRFARKFRAKQISVRTQAADPRHQLPQGFARFDGIDTGVLEFALQPHILGLFGDRNLNVVYREYCHHIARLQRHIVNWIALEDRFAQVERHQCCAQVFGVEALDDGIAPVDFVEIALDLVGEFGTGFILILRPRLGALPDPQTYRCVWRRSGHCGADLIRISRSARLLQGLQLFERIGVRCDDVGGNLSPAHRFGHGCIRFLLLALLIFFQQIADGDIDPCGLVAP